MKGAIVKVVPEETVDCIESVNVVSDLDGGRIKDDIVLDRPLLRELEH